MPDVSILSSDSSLGDRASSHLRVSAAGRLTRIAVLCDFVEEGWLSMNLVGDMLARQLANEFGRQLHIAQLRPPLRRRLTRLPFVKQQVAWNADRLMNRMLDYPVWMQAKRGDFDLFHVIDHSYSQLVHVLPAGRTVVTCHDLDTFRCLLAPEREIRPFWFRAMSRRILNGFQKAAHVIAVSAATRDELVRHDLFPLDRISVIPNGVHPSYSPLRNPAADQAVAHKFAVEKADGPWLLSVGSTMARKRLDVLLRIFAEVRREMPDARLVRVGGLTAELERLAGELRILDAISIVPFLETEVLAAVYRRSALLLHTAEAEGFGLPVIEAMASGCPVVANDIPVLREVGGEAAVYCTIQDIKSWTDRVTSLLRERSGEAEKWELRRQRGLVHASGFSWAENARQTLSVYQKVVANSG
jgi:glycosyltransferase involved in cell wall biosynthesis